MLTKFPNKTTLLITIAMSLMLAIFIIHIININFSYYWFFLHSDIVTDLAFIREAANSISLFPEGWAHINEMRFIYVTTPAILFYWITGNVHLAYSLAVSFMLIVNVALLYYMLSFKKRNAFIIFSGAIMFLMFFSRYQIFSVFSILFVNGSLSVHLATVFLTIGVYLRIKYKTNGAFRGEKILWVITLLLAFAQGIQSTRMLGILYAPLLIVELIPVLRSVNNKQYKINGAGMLYALLAFLLNGLGMFVISRLIDSGAVIVEASSITFRARLATTDLFIERFLDAISTLFHTFGLIGGDDLVSTGGLIFSIRISIIFAIILIYANIQKDDADRNLANVLVATVISSVILQALTTIGMGERFNFTATSLMAALFVIVLTNIAENISTRNELSIKEDKSDKLSLREALASLLELHNIQMYIAGVGVILVIVGSLLSMNNLGTERNYSLVEDRERIVEFLAEENLTVGYGAFWQGLVISGVANWDVIVIPFRSNSGVVGNPLRQGVSYHDFFHNENRVFLIASDAHIEEAYTDDRMGPVLEQGERHDFPGRWVVYIFEFNPWADFKH